MEKLPSLKDSTLHLGDFTAGAAWDASDAAMFVLTPYVGHPSWEGLGEPTLVPNVPTKIGSLDLPCQVARKTDLFLVMFKTNLKERT